MFPCSTFSFQMITLSFGEEVKMVYLPSLLRVFEVVMGRKENLDKSTIVRINFRKESL